MRTLARLVLFGALAGCAAPAGSSLYTEDGDPIVLQLKTRDGLLPVTARTFDQPPPEGAIEVPLREMSATVWAGLEP